MKNYGTGQEMVKIPVFVEFSMSREFQAKLNRAVEQHVEQSVSVKQFVKPVFFRAAAMFASGRLYAPLANI